MAETQELKRVLGLGSIFAVSVGLVCASSTLVSNINGFGIAGPAFIISLLLAFLVNFLVVLSYAELATTFPKAGQIYEYTKEAFEKGKLILSTGAGTTYWGMMGFVFAAEVSAGAWALQYATGIGSLWSWILLITLTCAIINLLGIRLTVWVEMGLVIFMITVRIGIGLLCASGSTDPGQFNFSNITNFAPFGWAAVTAAIPLAFWNFVGLEFACPLVEETIQPERNLPWGMILGSIAILWISFIFGLGIVGVIDPINQTDILTGDNPQMSVGEALLGRFGMLLMGIASFTATFGCLNVAFASIPRIAYAMARDGLWPKIFAYVHPRFKTPWAAIILTFVLFTVGPLLWSDVVSLIYAASFIWLLVYLWTHFLVLKLKIEKPMLDRPFSNYMATPIIGSLLILWVLYASFKESPELILLGLAFMAVCFLFAWIWVRTNSKNLSSRLDEKEIVNLIE